MDALFLALLPFAGLQVWCRYFDFTHHCIDRFHLWYAFDQLLFASRGVRRIKKDRLCLLKSYNKPPSSLVTTHIALYVTSLLYLFLVSKTLVSTSLYTCTFVKRCMGHRRE